MSQKEISDAMDITEIKEVLPHRYPFLLLDRVEELVPGERIVGLKNVTVNEPFFQGHFPEYPVMPGVLILEALAQAGALMMLRQMEEGTKAIPFFTGIDKARFRRQVVPGDQLRLEVTVLKQRLGLCRLAAKAMVDDELVAEAEISVVAKAL
jgi:3-hydroxyacyl-[acyl-carrier-protein] dehydratase